MGVHFLGIRPLTLRNCFPFRKAHCTDLRCPELNLSVSYLTVAVIKYHNPGNLEMEGFILAYVSRGTSAHHGREKRKQARMQEQKAERSHPPPQA